MEINSDFSDVVISGGGLAGLVAAAAFAHANYSVVLVDPNLRSATIDSIDVRSTAYLQPAQTLLQDIGLWQALRPLAVPLERLRVADCTGEAPKLRDERTFHGEESADEPLGWNIPNALARRELLNYLGHQPNVELRLGIGFAGVLNRTGAAIVQLDDASRITAKLLIGADGRHSQVRSAVGIPVRTTRYGQKSLAFTATHTLPHNNVSTEIYHKGGPFTQVPLADIDGIPASAIIWMNTGKRTAALAAMKPNQFNGEMTARSAGLMGQMALAGGRAIWPIITLVAHGLTAGRTAIIAEAAHVLPPIGAQGLNTSLNDIAALLASAQKFPSDFGGPDMLASYQSDRLPDIKNRARAIDLFNRVTRSGEGWMQSVRLIGLRAAHDIRPIRRGLIRAGMGPHRIARNSSSL